MKDMKPGEKHLKENMRRINLEKSKDEQAYKFFKTPSFVQLATELEQKEKEGKKIVYISGGITGVQDCIEHFNKAERYLQKLGHEVINPIRLSVSIAVELPFEPSYEDYMAVDKIFLKRADAIYLLKGYDESSGARREHEFAVAHGLEVLYEGEY